MLNLAKIFIILILINTSFAGEINPQLEKCFIDASQKYQIPKEVLIAIAGVESKYNASAINKNKNGSYDLGIMQINSSWLAKLNNMGITEKSLHQPCQNIMVGAWILAQNINTYGFNWVAIQRYNGSDTQLKYAQKIRQQLEILLPKLFVESDIKKNTTYVKSAESKHMFLYVQ